MPTHAADLAVFLRKLDAGPVHLVGWSYSAQIALEVARRHPELVRSVFVYEPSEATHVSDPAALTEIERDAAAFAPMAQALEAGDDRAAARAPTRRIRPARPRGKLEQQPGLAGAAGAGQQHDLAASSGNVDSRHRAPSPGRGL